MSLLWIQNYIGKKNQNADSETCAQSVCVDSRQPVHCGASGMPLASVTWPSCRFLTSWASQRLVVASSFSTWAKVLSFSWSGRHWRRASLALQEKTQKHSFFLPITASGNTNRALHIGIIDLKLINKDKSRCIPSVLVGFCSVYVYYLSKFNKNTNTVDCCKT